MQQGSGFLDAMPLGEKSLPAGLIDEADAVADFAQPEIGIVFPKQQAVFGSGGKKAVRFLGTEGDKVVNEDAGVGLGAVEDQGIFSRT